MLVQFFPGVSSSENQWFASSSLAEPESKLECASFRGCLRVIVVDAVEDILLPILDLKKQKKKKIVKNCDFYFEHSF